jgi:Peptidase family M1 domain
LEFHYPAGWTLLATGKRVDSSSSGSRASASVTEPQSRQVSRWVSDRPIPLAGFNLGKYSRADAKAGNIPVETYAALSVERAFPKAQAEVIIPDVPTRGRRQPPLVVTIPSLPSPAQNAQPLAERAAQAIDFFSERFGPYPYSHLALTQMPGNLSQGWPGLIFLSSVSFLTPQEEAQLHMSEVHSIESAMVVPHETAHQWWGDLIVWSGYRDQWMVEALANYSALMLLESKSPAKFRAVIDSYRNDLLTKNKDGRTLLEAGPVTLGSRLSNSQFPNGYDSVSYGRGTWLLHMLRCMMRDGEAKPGSTEHFGAPDSPNEPFVRALRKLRERYEGKSLTTRELLNVFAEELPSSLNYEGRKSLDWFYEGWVNGTAIPHFELQAVKYLDKNATTLITGAIVQKDSPRNLISSVPIYATVNGRMILLARIFTDGPETPFRISAPTGARRVVVDPKQTLLARPR